VVLGNLSWFALILLGGSKMILIENALWDEIVSTLEFVSLSGNEAAINTLNEILKAKIENRPKLLKGTRIRFIDSEAVLTEDWNGSGMLQVECDGVEQEWRRIWTIYTVSKKRNLSKIC
jgi:hypothetical protein